MTDKTTTSTKSVLSIDGMEHLFIITSIYPSIWGRSFMTIGYKIKFGKEKVNKSQIVFLTQELGITGFIKLLWKLNIYLY